VGDLNRVLISNTFPFDILSDKMCLISPRGEISTRFPYPSNLNNFFKKNTASKNKVKEKTDIATNLLCPYMQFRFIRPYFLDFVLIRGDRCIFLKKLFKLYEYGKRGEILPRIIRHIFKRHFIENLNILITID